jgi:hypothetical protein
VRKHEHVDCHLNGESRAKAWRIHARNLLLAWAAMTAGIYALGVALVAWLG